MKRIYRYILTHNSGIAPCPDDGFLTLSCCKPSIRRNAREGDWLLGFQPGRHNHGLLLWGGRVARSLSHADYEKAFRGRKDALYRSAPNGEMVRLNMEYHASESEIRRDLIGNVLIFDMDVSFHTMQTPIPLPENLQHLAASGRGHRVSNVKEGDQERLAEWMKDIASSSGQPSVQNSENEYLQVIGQHDKLIDRNSVTEFCWKNTRCSK